jgi:hypothetical protein
MDLPGLTPREGCLAYWVFSERDRFRFDSGPCLRALGGRGAPVCTRARHLMYTQDFFANLRKPLMPRRQRSVAGKSYDEVMPFIRKAERWCSRCEEMFVTSIFHERIGRELGPPQETACPSCGRQGMMLAEVPPEVRRPAVH